MNMLRIKLTALKEGDIVRATQDDSPHIQAGQVFEVEKGRGGLFIRVDGKIHFFSRHTDQDGYLIGFESFDAGPYLEARDRAEEMFLLLKDFAFIARTTPGLDKKGDLDSVDITVAAHLLRKAKAIVDEINGAAESH